MLKFNKDLSLDHLPVDVYEDLVTELSKDDSWKILAQYVAEKLEYSRSWITNLENKTSAKSPAEQLLAELNTKMCTIEILCTLLENCNLLNALSIMHIPEPLYIITHPDDNGDSSIRCISLGEQLMLVCKAHGLPPPRYQWYHKDQPLEEQNSEELNITIKSIAEQGVYKCQVYQVSHKGQEISSVFSNSVFINVNPTPVVIEKQPELFVEVKENACLVIKCEANSHPGPQFQWYKDNYRLDDQTTNILRIEKVNAKDEGKYYCHIFNNISEKYTEPSTVVIEEPRQRAVAKVALLIANEKYDHQEALGTPRNDVARVATILNDLGFRTICLADLTLLEMGNAIKLFCDSLVEGAYGFFYFAGHGFKMQENYMLPVDAPTDYLRKDAICESQLLSPALKSDPALLVVILDMCQTFPQVDCNPRIHEEIPCINEYKGQKNLRNLLQAYSTSSYRPSYERLGNDYGLYARHLCKYLDENIPITKVFEKVGRSIDTWLKGAERKQIPMFATTITKSFRLTDSVSQKLPSAMINLEKLIAFPNKVVDINFQQTGVKCKAMISQYMKPYLNLIEVNFLELDEKWEINVYNFHYTKRNNLFQCNKNKYWLHNPQINEGPLVISILENGVHVGATLLEINELVPSLLNKLSLYYQ